MFCPQCQTEYRPGFTECPDCSVSLVDELQPEPEPTPEGEFVKVYETADATLIPVVQSLLGGAGIQVLTKGESVLDLFAFGRLGGMNVVGPAMFFVHPTNAEAARVVLAELDEAGTESEAATED
jgi:hypothetical protein